LSRKSRGNTELPKNIKILHISESSETGGAETVVLDIVTHLDQTRFDSTIVLLKTGWLKEKLEERGLSPILLESHRSYDIGFLKRLCSTIRHHGVDLIHSHLPDANAYSCLAGLWTGVPVLATYHGMLSGAGEERFSDRAKFFLVRNIAKKSVAVSDALRRELIGKAHFPPDRVQRIYNGVEWERFDNRFDAIAKKSQLRIGPDDKVVGMIANLKPTKGYEYFIRCCEILSKEYEKIKFLIIGEGTEEFEDNITQKVRKLGLENHLLFLGFREDIAELLQILDVFVLSSLSEGMSLAIVEAMGVGIPVVATKSGGPEELIEDGKTGFLVPPRDEKSLAEKVSLLLKNKELARSMGMSGKSSVREKFSIRAMIGKYENTYRSCLGKGE
jgi:glycosyltransferase involved in cell wall biosynthesis